MIDSAMIIRCCLSKTLSDALSSALDCNRDAMGAFAAEKVRRHHFDWPLAGVELVVRLLTVTNPPSLVTTWAPDASCCAMAVSADLVVCLLMVTNLPSLVTTWAPEAFCCVMVVSVDFFEQLPNANGIIASAINDAGFFIILKQTPCSRKRFASCRRTTALTRAASLTVSMQADCGRGIECSARVRLHVPNVLKHQKTPK
jgi:hypothetical protein